MVECWTFIFQLAFGLSAVVIICGPIGFVSSYMKDLLSIIGAAEALLVFSMFYGLMMVVLAIAGFGIVKNKDSSAACSIFYSVFLFFAVFLPLASLSSNLRQFHYMQISEYEELCN